MQPLKTRITQDPEICHGKPCIRGMRFPVEVVLDLLGSGMTEEEILADHPELEAEDILACLEFAKHLQSSMKQYQISFPEEIAFSLKMQDEEFAYEIKKMALIKLFELGKVSSGKAAKALGMPRITFLEMLGRYGVSMFNDVSEESLKNDIKNA